MADRPEHFEVFEWLRSSCTFVILFESERNREELLPIGNLVSILANSPFCELLFEGNCRMNRRLPVMIFIPHVLACLRNVAKM